VKIAIVITRNRHYNNWKSLL